MFQFDDDVPHGNALLLSSAVEDGIWTIRFTPAAKNGAERLWYHGRLCNRGSPAGSKVRLVLCEVDCLLGGKPWDEQTHRPAWCADDGEWQRLPAGEVTVDAAGTIQVSWLVDAPERFAQICVCMPYGIEQLQETLATAPHYWQQHRIGTSCQDRALLRLDNGEQATGKVPGIYCTARNHSGETPGAWCLDGFMRRFAERKVTDCCLWVVPFVDRDGVEQGCYGKDHWPRDFNRAWTGSQSYRHEVAQIQRDARRWADQCQPMLHLDWHAPGMVDQHPHIHDESTEVESLSEAMAKAYGIGYEGFRRNASYAADLFNELGMNTAPNCTTWFRKQFGIRAITTETPYMQIDQKPLLIEDYQRIGGDLADVCLAWCREQMVPC